MVLGWQSVEYYVHQMTQEFELLFYPKKTDPRIDILRDRVGFGTKVEFLNQMGRISEEDRRFLNSTRSGTHCSMETSSPAFIP